jgi:hypothetical protein
MINLHNILYLLVPAVVRQLWDQETGFVPLSHLPLIGWRQLSHCEYGS